MIRSNVAEVAPSRWGLTSSIEIQTACVRRHDFTAYFLLAVRAVPGKIGVIDSPPIVNRKTFFVGVANLILAYL